MKSRLKKKKQKSVLTFKKQLKMASTHSATLNAVVNPKGADTAVTFSWGIDTNYGNTATVPGVLSGGTDQNVSADITGLEAETVYHFKVISVNSVGETDGDDLSFTTLADQATAPTAVTMPATNIT